MGRPPKFENVENLQEQITAYFRQCEERERTPTKAGLAVYLDTTRETLGDYEKKEGFSDTLKRTYSMIEDEWVQLLARGGGAGPIFYLKNAFSYRDKSEVDHTTKGDKIDTVNVKIHGDSQPKGD